MRNESASWLDIQSHGTEVNSFFSRDSRDAARRTARFASPKNDNVTIFIAQKTKVR